MPKINPLLTKRMHEVLTLMRDDPDAEGEIVWEKGAGWWIGNNRTNGKLAHRLLHLCLLHEEDFNKEDFVRYTLNSDGKNIIDDPKYVPAIMLAFKQKGKKNNR